MATATNTFKVPTKSDGGGDFKTEVPTEDTHEARVVALIDLGVHSESFGNEPPKDQHKVFIVYELDEEMTGMKGVNHVVGVRYTLSGHVKSNLRQLAEALLNEGQSFTTADIDYSALLGLPCTVQIAHKKVETPKGERTYVNVGTVAAVGKKQRDRVFKPKREVASWSVGQPLEELPDYLPRIYGEKVEDVIARCKALSARPGKAVAAPGEGEVGGDDPNDPPFGFAVSQGQ